MAKGPGQAPGSAWVTSGQSREYRKEYYRTHQGQILEKARVKALREKRETAQMEKSLAARRKPGKCRCLRCDREFYSWDKRHNRLCEHCRTVAKYLVED